MLGVEEALVAAVEPHLPAADPRDGRHRLVEGQRLGAVQLEHPTGVPVGGEGDSRHRGDVPGVDERLPQPADRHGHRTREHAGPQEALVEVLVASRGVEDDQRSHGEQRCSR
ncbi:hypothetical protein ACI8AC_17605 [Geodermatophilus sp. SYSU D00758]